MHATPLHYTPGRMRRWIEEDNKGVEIMGSRWLTREHEPGKVASCLINNMKSGMEIGKGRMGRELFHTQDMVGIVSIKRTWRASSFNLATHGSCCYLANYQIFYYFLLGYPRDFWFFSRRADWDDQHEHEGRLFKSHVF